MTMVKVSKSAFLDVLFLNELSGNVDNITRFLDADGVKETGSGYSFGRLQYDVNANPDSLKFLKEHCNFSEKEINRLVNRDPHISDLQDKLRLYKSEILEYDLKNIDKYFLYFSKLKDLPKLENIKTLFHLLDYHNQYYISINGRMHGYLKTLKVVTSEDVYRFKLQTMWGKKRPDDVKRRFNTIESYTDSLISEYDYFELPSDLFIEDYNNSITIIDDTNMNKLDETNKKENVVEVPIIENEKINEVKQNINENNKEGEDKKMVSPEVLTIIKNIATETVKQAVADKTKVEETRTNNASSDKTDLSHIKITNQSANVVAEYKAEVIRSKFNSWTFWSNWLSKLFSLFISAKMIGLGSILSISTFLVMRGYITGGNWVTVNCTCFPVIYAIREVFKIENVSAMVNKNNKDDDIE